MEQDERSRPRRGFGSRPRPYGAGLIGLLVFLAGAAETFAVQDRKAADPAGRRLTECYVEGEPYRTEPGRCPGVELRCTGTDCIVEHRGVERRVQVGAARGPQAGPGSGPFDQPVILDPVCAWYEWHDMDCPRPDGGGGSPPPSGGGHHGDLDCTWCSVKYAACFSSCAIAWFPTCHALCAQRFLACTKNKCE